MINKATPDQWRHIEKLSAYCIYDKAILELRDRIVQLEHEVSEQAQALASVTADCVRRIAALESATNHPVIPDSSSYTESTDLTVEFPTRRQIMMLADQYGITDNLEPVIQVVRAAFKIWVDQNQRKDL
jgi:hypothetical protein